MRGLQSTSLTGGCVLTMGNFDGIHLGHQALLKITCDIARQLQLPSCLMTFEPHPMEFFLKETVMPRLMRLREKLITIATYGLDQVCVLRFNQALATMMPEAFIESILKAHLNVNHVIVGEDFRFGKNRCGDVGTLKKAGLAVTAVPSVQWGGERVSSSRVRKALAEADHCLVQALLGRPYSMMGRIVHGDKRGRILGFPTANIYLHRAATPVQGVYAVRMHHVLDRPVSGVANVGMRPTVGGTRSLLEVHLFDFHEDIYGRYVEVEFVKKIRNEERYANLDLLKQQIFKDADAARAIFRAEDKE